MVVFCLLKVLITEYSQPLQLFQTFHLNTFSWVYHTKLLGLFRECIFCIPSDCNYFGEPNHIYV